MNILKLLWELACLKRNEHKSPAQMQKIQREKLRKLLVYAFQHSAYYHREFVRAGITESNIHVAPLSAFPVIDKKVLLQNFDELVTVPDLTQEELRRFDAEASTDRKPYKGKYHVVHSSGSTGKPGYFVYDNAAWRTMLLGIIRAALWGMSMPQILRLLAKGPRIAYIAATDGRYGGAMAVGDGIDGVGASQIHLDIKQPLSQWVEQLKAFQPNIIIGYPSAIKILGELVERGDIELSVLRVISCGEPLGAGLRGYLEKVFAAPVINTYGASESLALGVESDAKNGMLLFDDLNVIEVENGEMYLTSLYNFAQPLIRYKLSDSLTLSPPANGSPFTRATGLLGRNEDMLWFEDDLGHRDFLHPLAIEGFCVEGLRDYQFQQTGSDSFIMLAEKTKSGLETVIQAEITAQMRGILEEKGLGYVEFSVGFVDEILPDPSTGKKRLIVQNHAERWRKAG